MSGTLNDLHVSYQSEILDLRREVARVTGERNRLESALTRLIAWYDLSAIRMQQSQP